MGWFSDFVSNPVGTVVDNVTAFVSNPIDTTNAAIQSTLDFGQNHAVESAAIVAAVATGQPEFAMTDATAESGAAALAPVSDAVAVPVSQIAPWAPASSNAAFDAALANSSQGLSWGQAASNTAAGLNLATSATKLSMLGKTMNASTPTANGLTGGLAASPIQTPGGLITTTPQGPVTAGPVAASGGFMGMDTQTLIVIAFAAGTIWYLTKHTKA
jgi:hypothetical protein